MLKLHKIVGILFLIIIPLYGSNTFAQTIDISGSCVSTTISLAKASDQVDGKPAFSGTGTVAGISNTSIALIWTQDDQVWLLMFDGQPFFYYSGNTPSPPNNTLGNWAVVPGTADDCAGATAIAISGAGTQNDPLPVNLASFYAEKDATAITLKWQTIGEHVNAGFEILKSSDLKNWNSIGFIDGNGTTKVRQHYQFIDLSPLSKINYYRLKQLDWDDSFELSKIIAVTIKTDKLELFPNPTSVNYFKLNLPDDQIWISAKIIDHSGKTLLSFIPENVVSIEKLPIGQYFLTVKSDSGQTLSKKFVKK